MNREQNCSGVKNLEKKRLNRIYSPAKPEPNGEVRKVNNTEDTESTEGHRGEIWVFLLGEDSIAISLWFSALSVSSVF